MRLAIVPSGPPARSATRNDFVRLLTTIIGGQSRISSFERGGVHSNRRGVRSNNKFRLCPLFVLKINPMPSPSLPPAHLAPIRARLHPTTAHLARRYPGESGARQPVHTVYGGAQLF